jgi:hypothetical protein
MEQRHEGAVAVHGGVQQGVEADAAGGGEPAGERHGLCREVGDVMADRGDRAAVGAAELLDGEVGGLALAERLAGAGAGGGLAGNVGDARGPDAGAGKGGEGV